MRFEIKYGCNVLEWFLMGQLLGLGPELLRFITINRCTFKGTFDQSAQTMHSSTNWNFKMRCSAQKGRGEAYLLP